jgi:hypothetical protein
MGQNAKDDLNFLHCISIGHKSQYCNQTWDQRSFMLNCGAHCKNTHDQVHMFLFSYEFLFSFLCELRVFGFLCEPKGKVVCKHELYDLFSCEVCGFVICHSFSCEIERKIKNVCHV